MHIIENGYSPPLDPLHPIMQEEDALHLNDKATNEILNVISDNVLEKITSIESAHQVWNKIEDIYGKSRYHLQTQGKSEVKVDDSSLR